MDEKRKAYLKEQLRIAVGCGYGDVETVREDFLERVRDEGAARLEGWQAKLERALDAQRRREQSWSKATINDRITAAFAELRAAGVIALEDAGYTMSDGWCDVGEASEDQPDAWAGVFFHRQDVERAIEGHGLWLAFGAFVEGEAHAPESLRLARLVCETLQRHGVKTTWNGEIDSRIEIDPFKWQKRRFTEAPSG